MHRALKLNNIHKIVDVHISENSMKIIGQPTVERLSTVSCPFKLIGYCFLTVARDKMKLPNK